MQHGLQFQTGDPLEKPRRALDQRVQSVSQA